MGSTTNTKDPAWRLRHQRIETLKKYQYPEPDDHQDARLGLGVTKMMNHRLYKSAQNDNADAILDDLEWVSAQNQVSVTAIFNQLSPSGNTLLHVASSSGSRNVTELLAVHFPKLITRANFQGDTAAHLAAKAGMVETLTTLVNVYMEKYKAAAGVLLEMRNEKGNTPLHEAVINKQSNVAHHIRWFEPELAYYQNNEGRESFRDGEIIKEGKSPLYLAAEDGDKEIFGILLQAIVKDGVASLHKLQGLSPAHAAVKHRRIEILEQIKEIKPVLLRGKDIGGNNALHYAAYFGYLKGVVFFLKEYNDGAIEQNEQGNYPIHVASKVGQLQVIQELLKQWPYNASEFVNRKGQNIVHVAAENGQTKVVEYILKNSGLSHLVNEKDGNRNTPLHLATQKSYPMVVFALAKANKVDHSILNNQNMTPYVEALILAKEAEENDQELKNKLCDTKSSERIVSKECKELDAYGSLMTYAILFFYGKNLRRPMDHFHGFKHKPISKEDLNGRINVLLVAAVLVSGAAFNGACQVPKSAAGGGGAYELDSTSNILLHFYFLFDLLALNFSVAAAIILCWVQLFDTKLSTFIVSLASYLVGVAIYQMFMTFLFALAIDAVKIEIVFGSIFMVGAIFFIIHTVLFIPLMVPPTASKMLENLLLPFFYILVFFAYFVFEHIIMSVSYFIVQKFLVCLSGMFVRRRTT
ncbi:protein ACCELERATED CELL DEATH 6-like [Mercurialis annua]|uniref:protein ACCELERATED CELL DEATH 6-like n=1 Tax=Mercurialis annua TaxID=3986 RepID=UPI00216040C5|nr:protein ACCELERATED CELL DEATH 6-like [Mercurialis annua]